MIHLPFPHASLLPSHLEREGEREGKKEEGDKREGERKGKEKKKKERRMGEKKLKGKGTFFDRREKDLVLVPDPKTTPAWIAFSIGSDLRAR